MFKELILAIIFGGLIGFGATGTFMAINKRNTNPANNSNIQNTITPTISQNQNDSNPPKPTLSDSKNSLNIFQPLNESVVSDSKLTIKGQTDKSSLVIITTIDSSYSTITDSSGNFDTIVNLNPGINQLKITTISPNDIENNTELFITYSTAKI